MKILMVADSFGDAYSANIKIGHLVAAAFAKRGVQCHFLAPEGEREAFTGVDGVTFHAYTHKVASYRQAYYDPHIQEHFAAVKDKPFSLVRKIGVLALHPIRSLRMLKSGAFSSKPQDENLVAKAYRDNIIRVLRNTHCNVLLGMYMPAEVLQALGEYTFPVPVFLYQLDPWALHELPLAQPTELRVQQELAAFEKASHIFTTPVLFAQYRTGQFSSFVQKMTPVSFPVLAPLDAKESQVKLLSAEGIQFLYAGSLTEEYRCPEFLARVFTHILKRHPEVKVYFMGVIQSSILDDLKEQFPGQVFLMGPKSPEEAKAATLEADFLLNIGNKMKNQMPSKIIECIGSGKPIVSTSKNPDDPVEELLTRYPLGLVLHEWKPIEESVAMLEAFIQTALGQRIPYNQVEQMFSDCTPEYVADQILQVISPYAQKRLL